MVKSTSDLTLNIDEWKSRAGSKFMSRPRMCARVVIAKLALCARARCVLRPHVQDVGAWLCVFTCAAAGAVCNAGEALSNPVVKDGVTVEGVLL